MPVRSPSGDAMAEATAALQHMMLISEPMEASVTMYQCKKSIPDDPSSLPPRAFKLRP